MEAEVVAMTMMTLKMTMAKEDVEAEVEATMAMMPWTMAMAEVDAVAMLRSAKKEKNALKKR